MVEGLVKDGTGIVGYRVYDMINEWDKGGSGLMVIVCYEFRI